MHWLGGHWPIVILGAPFVAATCGIYYWAIFRPLDWDKLMADARARREAWAREQADGSSDVQ